MKGMWKAALAILVAAACGGDAITEPSAPNALLQPGVLAIGVDTLTGASIETNKDDYLPGEVVHVVGKGWAPGETVNLHMTEEPNTHADVDTNVVADAAGEFSIHYYDVQPHDLGVTFTLTATGGTSASVAVATFRDGQIQVEVAPAFYPSASSTSRRFSVLVSHTTISTTRCVKITVPYSASFVSVTGSTGGWSGSASGNVITVASANALTTASDWVRVEVDATPPSTSNADWSTTSWTNQACNGTQGNIDDPVVNIGLTQNWTYTADFRDAGGAIVSETGTAGTPKTYRVRLTNTSGSNGDNGIFAVIALPPCFSAPTSVTVSSNGTDATWNVDLRDNFIRLSSGILTKNTNQHVQVQFTTTPQNGCSTVFSSAMWKSSEHNSSENDTFTITTHPSVTLGAVNVATTTEVLASTSPTVFGQSVTFTATVTPASGPAPTGTVNFYEFTGGQTCAALGGAVALGTDGTAPFELVKTDLSVGAHTISACFTANAGWTNSSDDVAHTVNKANTTLTPTDSPDPSVFGESVAFGATVAVAAPGTGTPTGDVKFFILSAGATCAAPGGSTQLGATQTLSGGAASVNYSTLAVGAHTITMCYMGDANYNAISNTAAHTVNKANVLVSVTDNPTSSSFGQSVTFTAAVSAVAPGVGTPTGAVTFYEFSAGQTCALPGAAVGSSDASAPYEFTTTSLSVGSHTITACYAGDGNFNANSGTDTHSVNATGTTTEVLSSPSPSVFGQSVTFTATVTPSSGGAAAGTVNFFEFTGAQTCDAPGAAVALGTDGSAPFEFTTSALGVGSHTISACFVANAGWTNSNDNVAHTVNKANVLVSVSDNPTSSVFGQSVTFAASVTAVSPGAGTPGGTVNFYELTGGQTCAAPGALLGTDASAPYEFTTSSLGVGAHTITACYGGNANFNENSGTDAHTVNKADVSVTVTDSPTSGQFGTSVTFTAALAAVAPGAGTPAGTVTFYEFTGAQSCTSPGAAVALGSDNSSPYLFTTNSLSVGAHTITACYGGDANFNAGSGTDSHTVDAVVTTVVASSPTATPQYSDEINLKAVVTPHIVLTSELTGVVRFYFQAGAASCAATDPGAAGSGVVASDAIAAADDGVADADYQLSTAAGNYTMTACFYSTNANFANGNDTQAITVTTEDATVTPDAGNINSIASGAGGTPVSSFTLKFVVKETNPEPDANAGALPGDLTNVGFGVVLQGVGVPGNNETGDCTPFELAGTLYNQTKTYTCTFSSVAVDAYEVVATVNGTYYDGTYSDAISVYDPNSGFVTGGGKFIFPGTTDRVNFGLVFMNPSKKALRGNLVVIRHMANGDICRAKSNGLEAPAVVGNAASFAGKGNFSCTRPDGTQYDASGNLTITGWVQDNGQGSNATGPDKFWVKVAGALNNNLVMPGTSANAAPLTGGNIQVPQPGGR